jgi:hypothetical protein
MTARYLRHYFALVICAALLGPSAGRAQGSLDEYQFTTPPGWQGQRYPDGIVLSSPASNTSERCLIQLWPTRPASQNLQQVAEQAFQDIFKTYQRTDQTSRGGAMPAMLIRGTSGQGWDYVILKQGIRHAPTAQMSYEPLLGWVFIARLTDRLAVISGMSKDPLISSCMGELIHNVWPEFFYHLKFRSWPATDQHAVLAKRMVGVWTTASATVADQYAFTANNRYGGASAVQHYNLVSPGTVLETTQAFFGDGAYALQGNSITLTPDDHNRRTENGFIRVEQECTAGASCVEILYLMRQSAVDGSIYEVRYKRNK